MKKINETFYEIEPELYAERRGARWFITDEQEEVQAGPFASLEVLQKSLKPGAQEIASWQGGVERVEIVPPGVPDDPDDLVTLTEGAKHLPVTPQALYAALKRGTLPVEPVVRGRTITLYSLRELKEKYPS